MEFGWILCCKFVACPRGRPKPDFGARGAFDSTTQPKPETPLNTFVQALGIDGLVMPTF
jgi:hypothetical protein